MYENNDRIAIIENSLIAAQDIQGALGRTLDEFEEAQRAKLAANQQYREAKATYDEAEAETVMDVMYSDEYAKGKNAEIRKGIMDVALISARSNGPLAAAWRAMNEAQSRLEQANLDYDILDARFKGVRVAAELQASHLNAVAYR